MIRLTALAVFTASFAVSALAQGPAPLVIISLDGMRPDYVTHADEHGLKIPALRAFLSQGTYAEGVTGVIPTVTYPSHTTLVTGVWPAEHGVVNNTYFDPLYTNPDRWYWEFSHIQVETLYQAADKVGLKTGGVSWPVTVGAPIDYNIAEYAQSEKAPPAPGAPYNPPDILKQLGIGPEVNRDSDEGRTIEAVAILKKYKPTLMLVHLAQMDHEEHQHAPFSPEADAALEVLDGQVARIEQAVLANDPNARIAIVSDHGFRRVDHHVNLNLLLADAALIRLGPPAAGKKQPTVVSWQASAWSAGGSAAIMLKDPNDATTRQKVRELLEKAKADPANGIAAVLGHEEIVRRGGFPEAAFLVDFKDHYQYGSDLTGTVVTDTPGTGTHGYLPSNPDLRSAFMVMGKGVAAGRDLHVIDMRQIAPTFAQMLGVTLPAAKLKPVNYKP